MNTWTNQSPCGALVLPFNGKLPTGAELSALERRGRCLRSAAMFTAARTLAGFLGRSLRGLRRGLSRRLAQRRAIAQLSRLDDRLLADIGMRREDIPRVVDSLARRSDDRGAETVRSNPSAGLALAPTHADAKRAANDDHCPSRAA